jgi:hypothetical protein
MLSGSKSGRMTIYSQSSNMGAVGWSTIALVLVLLLSAAFLYIWTFIFIRNSGPKGQPLNEYVMKLCSKRSLSFARSLFTWGYCKRAFKNCYRYYRLKLYPAPFAKLGKRCPDAKLVDLDGNVRSLLADYVDLNSDIPLVLNMGSYT